MLGQFLVLGFLAIGADARQGVLERLLLASQLTDALGDQLGLDSLLERLDLSLDLALDAL